jgi:Holliday junction DNA helicase RuvA
MLARLKGILSEKSNDHVIIDVGGVGYQVFLSALALSGIPSDGETVSLYIHTHVREDQLTLFGFATREEKAIFLRLMDVSGIGPKMAMSILSGMAPHDIVNAVVKEDLARLHAIPGIGRKTAERIVVDLKDKFIKEFGGGASVQPADKPLYNDAVSALVNLGYQRASAEKALAGITFEPHMTVQAIVRQALRQLKI